LFWKAIAEHERELEKLAAKIDSAGRGTVETHPGNIRAFITNGLRNLLALLSGDTTRARAELKYTSDIRMIPEIDENGGDTTLPKAAGTCSAVPTLRWLRG